MNVLVTGASGLLGTDVVEALERSGHTAVATSSRTLDIRDEVAVQEAIACIRPDAVIHCAAWTAADAAEKEENREIVWDVNVNGTAHIAKACGQVGCKLLYPSSDYIFDGTGTAPWKPEDKPNPVNWYGESKLAGERAVVKYAPRHFVVRISWLYGKHGKNFADTMLAFAREGRKISVVDDQIGTPTYTPHLAALFVKMIESEQYGTYNAVNEGGYISWYDLACEVFSLARKKGLLSAVPAVTPVSSKDYAALASRPLNSRMDTSKLAANGFDLLPHWSCALAEYISECAANR